jgi:hypothetical protein
MKLYVWLCILLMVLGNALFARSASEQEALTKGVNGKLSYIGRYPVGSVNEDGGIVEIVQYNKDNKRIYLVNGALDSLDIVDVSALRLGSFTSLNLYKRIELSTMGNTHGFSFGDLTSVAISTKNKTVALAI